MVILCLPAGAICLLAFKFKELARIETTMDYTGKTVDTLSP